MSPDQRRDAYYAQNGRTDLTPAQTRRCWKKWRRARAAADKAVERDTKPATS